IGVFRTTDTGFRWTTSNTGLTDQGTFIANDIRDVAADAGNIFVATGNGVFRSTDNGANWTPTKMPINHNNVGWLDMKGLALLHSYLFVGTQGGGLFRSSDDGQTWTELNVYSIIFAAAYVYALTVIGDELFASTFGGLLRSTDDGNTWSQVGVSLSYAFVQYGRYLVAAVPSGLPGSGLYRSGDDGQSWSLVSTFP